MRPATLCGVPFGSFVPNALAEVRAPDNLLIVAARGRRALWAVSLLCGASPSFGIRTPVCCDTVSTLLQFTRAAAVVCLLLPGLCAPLPCPAFICCQVLCEPFGFFGPASLGSSDLANARVRSDAAILLAEA